MMNGRGWGRTVWDWLLLLRPAGGADVTFRPRPALPSLDNALRMDTPATQETSVFQVLILMFHVHDNSYKALLLPGIKQ